MLWYTCLWCVCLCEKASVVRVVNDVELSRLDSRKVKLLELSNGLRALLVEDSSSETAGMGVAVGVGGSAGPKEAEGLAHFLEHMLLWGSVKYPTNNYLMKKIREHSGTFGGATNDVATIYIVQSALSGFDEIVQIFADHFKNPLLNEEGVFDELESVEKEFLKSRTQTSTKSNHLRSILANPAQRLNRFHAGNKRSLYEVPKSKGLDIVKELRKFHDNYYSADITSVVISSPAPLEESEKLVLTHFSDLENKNVLQTDLYNEIRDIPTYLPEHLGRIAFYENKTSEVTIRMIFPTIVRERTYRKKPHFYTILALKSSHENSLSEILSKKGLATYIECLRYESPNAFNIIVDFSLSKRNVTDKIIQEIGTHFFVYLRALESEPLMDFYLEEIEKMARLSFEYSVPITNKQIELRTVALNVLKFPATKIFSGDLLVPKPPAEDIITVMKLMRPDHMQVHIQMPTNMRDYDHYIEEYNLKYSIQNINSNSLKKWLEVRDLSREDVMKLMNDMQMTLVPHNPYVPNDISLKFPNEVDIFKKKKNSEKIPIEKNIFQYNLKSYLNTIWFWPDKFLGMPTASIYIFVKAPSMGPSPLASVKMNIYTNIIFNRLSKIQSQLKFADYSIDISARCPNNLVIGVTGYNDHIIDIANILVSTVANNKPITSREFEVGKLDYQHSLTSANTVNMQVISKCLEILRVGFLTKPKKYYLTNTVNVEQLNIFQQDITKDAIAQISIVGNLSYDDALMVGKNVEKHIHSSPKHAGQLPWNTVLLLPSCDTNVSPSACMPTHIQQPTLENIQIDLQKRYIIQSNNPIYNYIHSPMTYVSPDTTSFLFNPAIYFTLPSNITNPTNHTHTLRATTNTTKTTPNIDSKINSTINSHLDQSSSSSRHTPPISFIAHSNTNDQNSHPHILQPNKNVPNENVPNNNVTDKNVIDRKVTDDNILKKKIEHKVDETNKKNLRSAKTNVESLQSLKFLVRGPNWDVNNTNSGGGVVILGGTDSEQERVHMEVLQQFFWDDCFIRFRMKDQIVYTPFVHTINVGRVPALALILSSPYTADFLLRKLTNYLEESIFSPDCTLFEEDIHKSVIHQVAVRFRRDPTSPRDVNSLIHSHITSADFKFGESERMRQIIQTITPEHTKQYIQSLRKRPQIIVQVDSLTPTEEKYKKPIPPHRPNSHYTRLIPLKDPSALHSILPLYLQYSFR